MSSVTRIVAILVLLLVVGGATALATMDIPAPTTKIEKVIPDDRLPR